MTSGEPLGSSAPGAGEAGSTRATPPAGWYPDSQSGGQRYWDGSRWTEHFQAAAVDPGPAAARGQSDARQWAMFAHLSALFALIIGLTWLGPLIIYLIKKDDDAFVADQAREALNFNISVFIYGVVGFIVVFVLTLILIGFLLIPVLIALGIGWLVLVILAAVKANSGQTYRYPLTIRMVS